MNKKNFNVAINYRHSAVGELLWMLPIIRSISIYNKKKVILFTRKETSAKLLLDKEDYIKEIIYLPFRKGIFQIFEIIKQSFLIKKKRIKRFYVLEEIVRPLVSAKIAGVDEIYSYGKKKQKKYLNQKKFLDQKIYQKHEFIRGKNFLDILSIDYKKFKKTYPLIDYKKEKFFKNKFKKYKNIIFLGLDAAESFRTWPINYYIDLINLIQKNYTNSFFFLLAYPKNKDKVFKIQNFLEHNFKKKNYLSLIKKDMSNIKYYTSISNIFIGNDSGPTILSDCLGTKTFCLYGATAPLPYENKIIKIFPKSLKKRFKKNDLIVQEHQKKNSHMNLIYPKDVYNRVKPFLKK
jgi:ADP-heptose:LPS heptosyltransferase